MNGLVFNSAEDIKKAILDNMSKVSISASKRVDSEFWDDIGKIAGRLAEIYRILDIVINYTDKKVDDIKFDSQMILWQGANSLIGALQLIRQGYFLEPNFLARNAIENLAITLTLLGNPRSYYAFQSGKLSGEKCIGAAKKIVPQIGQIYGQLSDATHPSKKWIGAYIVRQRKTMMIGGGIVDEHMYRTKMNLSMLGFLIVVYLSGVELIFFDFIKDHKFWTKKANGTFEWSPSESEKKYGKKIEKLMLEAIEELNKTTARGT